MKNTEMVITKEIIKYDKTLKYSLLRCQYNNDEQELKNDLIGTMKEENGYNELLEYYKNDLISRNDTNSTEAQRKQLSSVVLMLEGQAV